MRKVLFVFLVAGVMLSAMSRPPIDEYGRSIYGHEHESIYKNYRGHTIERHVKKTTQYLKNRCLSQPPKGGHVTSYKNIYDAQETMMRITYDKINRRTIDLFQRSKTKGTKALYGKLVTGIQRKYYSSNFSYMIALLTDYASVPGKHGYGYGYECSKVVPGSSNPCARRKGWMALVCLFSNLYRGLSGFSATYSHAKAVLKYNIHKQRWFYLTSYPVK